MQSHSELRVRERTTFAISHLLTSRKDYITSRRLLLSLADAGGRLMYAYKDILELEPPFFRGMSSLPQAFDVSLVCDAAEWALARYAIDSLVQRPDTAHTVIWQNEWPRALCAK